MMSTAARVLVVEDEDAIRALLVAALRREPFEVDEAADGAAALQLTREHEYAVIVLDLMMPRVDGFSFIEAFRAASPDTRTTVVVLTAFDDSMIGRLRPDQVHAIVRKPFDVPQLVAMVREVAATWTSHAAAHKVADPLPAQQPDLPLSADDPVN